MRLFPDFSWGVATVWQEARSEPQEGRIAVGNVIRNRMAIRNRTVAQVVLEPKQFSGWNSIDPNRIPAAMLDGNDPIVSECADAWLSSEYVRVVKDATLYVNLAVVVPDWAARAEQIAQIGRHTFFRERKS